MSNTKLKKFKDFKKTKQEIVASHRSYGANYRDFVESMLDYLSEELEKINDKVNQLYG